MFCSSNSFVIGITVSVWTVVQTSFHIIWALCGYYFYVCKIKPGHYLLVILYLTYFYRHDCGDIEMDSATIFAPKKEKRIINLASNDTDKDDLYDIIQTILEKAVLPEEANAAWRTHMYIHAFIISDAVWIISAFLLFAATCFQIKKCLSLLFYCPWLVATACVIVLDVVSSVHFGLDILKIYSFTTWLKFIGVQNYQDFASLNEHEASSLIPVLPVITVCVLFSRLVIFWLLNIVQFFQILSIAVMAFQDNLDGKSQTGSNRTRTRTQNPNNSEFRIRNWQLFYGATESTDTGTSDSASSKASSRDCNSNESMRGPSKFNTRTTVADSNTLPIPRQSFDSVNSYMSTYYQRYSDVEEGVDNRVDEAGTSIDPSRRQLPWSYFNAPEGGHNGGQTSSNVFENDSKELTRFRRQRDTFGNVASTEL